MFIYLAAWAAGLHFLVRNHLRRGRLYTPPSWWWTTIPFGIFGFMADDLSGSLWIGIIVGLIFAVLGYLWGNSKLKKKSVSVEQFPSYKGRQGTVAKRIYYVHDKFTIEGKVKIDGDRKVYAITFGNNENVKLEKGDRVVVVGHDAKHNRIIVESLDSAKDASYIIH